MKVRLTVLVGAWVALSAATPLPLTPSPPDLVGLVPWASAPLDKPPIELPKLSLPAPPVGLPTVPPAPLEAPAEAKPMAPLPRQSALSCAGAWLNIASLDCGRARLAAGDLDEALRALEVASRGAGDRDSVSEARYWYAETLYRTGRYESADWPFRQVAQDQGRREFGLWALHGSGWTALRLGDLSRARDAFTQLLSVPHPVPLDVWGRHGLALALYGLGQYEEAAKWWTDLAQRRVPAALQRDLQFWRAETQGRMGDGVKAADELSRFVQGGRHPLLGAARVRLGWWNLRAGRTAEADAAFRAFLAAPTGPPSERDWAEAGLVLAQAEAGDWAGARESLKGLDSRRSPLTVALRIRLAARAFEAGQAAETQAAVQGLLAASLAPGVRPWVLLLKGEAHRAAGNRDEARTQFELARAVDANSDTGRHAIYRLAQTNFELREFGEAQRDLVPLVAAGISPEILVPALLLQAEAAYHAGDYATAEADYRRVLTEAPEHAQTAGIRMALAWTVMRQGQRDDARRLFMEFVQAHPTDEHAADALVLASELALQAGALEPARELLDQVIANYPSQSRTDFARLNRAILLVRDHQPLPALRILSDWVARAPFPPLLARAKTALGVALLASRAPSEALKAFTAARQEGADALATLGIGVAALEQRQWDVAQRELTVARDAGTAEVAATAEYALAVVAFHRGAVPEFRQGAQTALKWSPRGPWAPGLLYALVGLSVDEKDWPVALATAKRLVDDFPNHDAADDALVRIGSAAAEAEAWPVAADAYGLLRQRYPQSPFAEDSRQTWAEALLQSGQSSEARRAFEEIVATAPTDPKLGQAWLSLARAREEAGDHAGAIEAFGRASAAGSSVRWTPEAKAGQLRALLADKHWSEARTLLNSMLTSGDTAAAADVAAKIGDTYQAEGHHLDAAEYYMTAAYLAPESAAGRQGLLGAGRSFAAMKQVEAAETVYKKLLAQSDVPAELVTSARQGLAEIKR